MGADIVIRVFTTGRYADRTPLSHAALRPLFADLVAPVRTPQEADLYLFGHVRDIYDADPALVEDWRRRRVPIVLMGDVPSWGAGPGDAVLAPHIHIDTAYGPLPVHQVNHHTSDVFRFDHIPYLLLTDHRFAGAYAHRFARNAQRGAAEWQQAFAACRTEILCLPNDPVDGPADELVDWDRDSAWPEADLMGQGGWTARFVRACGAGRVHQPAPDPRATPRTGAQRHLDRLVHWDGQARFMTALGAVHHPSHMGAGFFDAFACGAVPIYSASSHHRLHDRGLPAAAWINAHGRAPEAVAETLPDRIDAAAYGAAQQALAQRLADTGLWHRERQRLARAVRTTLHAVLDQPARPRPAPRLAKPAARLARFHNAHAGERCILVCNGPSLNRMDLRPLRRHTVIGLNKIYLGRDRFGFEPDYLVAVNDKVIAQSAEAYAGMASTKFFTDRATDIVPPAPDTFHMRTHDVDARFSRDITRGVHEGWTVTHAALQIAYFMGFEEVIIIGMDHRFQGDAVPNAPLYMAGADPNHFSPDYFRGQTWDAPDLVQSEDSYRAARAAFEQDNRRIIDATVDGACTVFAKIPYADLTSL
ncbi:MAG: 6-hydroxymethylpterin diphosphokinase MptE-like protein [Pseudomonadota bacterium]